MTDGRDLGAIVEGLLGLPIEEFTPRRNAIVKELKSHKEAALAAQVQALRKPSVQLWAVNQLAREGALLRAVREAAQAAMQAQLNASATDLRQAVAAFDRALDQAARGAGEAMTAAGHAASDAATQRARALLRLAALADTETWGLLESGRLGVEPEAGGLGAFVAGHRGGPPPASAAGRAIAPRSGSRRETQQATRDDEAKRKAADQERAVRARAAEETARAADEAMALARRLRAEADELAASMTRAEQRAAEAEEQATRAREQAEAAQRALDALGMIQA